MKENYSEISPLLQDSPGVQLTVSDAVGSNGCGSDFKWVNYWPRR